MFWKKLVLSHSFESLHWKSKWAKLISSSWQDSTIFTWMCNWCQDTRSPVFITAVPSRVWWWCRGHMHGNFLGAEVVDVLYPFVLCLVISIYMESVLLCGTHWQQMLSSSNHGHEEWRRLAMMTLPWSKPWQDLLMVDSLDDWSYKA